MNPLSRSAGTLNIYSSMTTGQTPAADDALTATKRTFEERQLLHLQGYRQHQQVEHTEARSLTQAVHAVILLRDKYLTPVRTDKNMMSSFSSYAASATSEHDLSEPLPALDDHRIPEGCPQSVSEPPTYCFRAAGVLRYNRESDNHRMNLATILPAAQPLTEYPVKCEYCGEKAKPSVDLTWVQRPETVPLFCCARWQELCEMLVKQRCLVGGRYDLRTGAPPLDEPVTEAEELLFRGREMEDHNKFITGLQSGLGEQSELTIYEDYSIQLPVAETSKGCWTVHLSSDAEMCLNMKEEEEQVLLPICDHKPLQFGICHHQVGSEFRQKYYSNGVKFLTVFPDGSAQVFYPSGLLALIVVVTEENGRVCIVYDDSDAPHQPIRAMFQSDGRAACYHSNGNIWLALNRSGGQCLDEEGTRVRRWSWSNLSLTTAPLQPVFLSLNRSVGIRVLGREQIFVSFLARGRQVKFSVGPCCAQGECKKNNAGSGPSVLKEELLLLAARFRIHLAFQHLHQYLTTPTHPWLPKTTQAPHLHVGAQRLLAVSAGVMMSDSDRDFIHRCLQDRL